MRTVWGAIAIWTAIVLVAAAGIALYAAGGMYIGLTLIGFAGTGAVLRIALWLALSARGAGQPPR